MSRVGAELAKAIGGALFLASYEAFAVFLHFTRGRSADAPVYPGGRWADLLAALEIDANDLMRTAVRLRGRG